MEVEAVPPLVQACSIIIIPGTSSAPAGTPYGSVVGDLLMGSNHHPISHGMPISPCGTMNSVSLLSAP